MNTMRSTNRTSIIGVTLGSTLGRASKDMSGFIALAVPLYRGRVPRNSVYGVRVPATLADDRVWYPINARGGRDLIALSCVYFGAVTGALVWGARRPLIVRFLGSLGLVVLGLLIEVVVLWMEADRLARAIHSQPFTPPS
jgi:hypothetical protein